MYQIKANESGTLPLSVHVAEIGTIPYKAKVENYTTKADLHQWLTTTRFSKGYSMTPFSLPVLYLCGIVPTLVQDFKNEIELLKGDGS